MTIQRNRIWNCGRKIGVADEKRTKITVEIKDKEYTIVGTESKEHVEYVVHLVNDKMNEIHQANKHLDTSKLAVLTAINTMNEFVILQEEFDELMKLIEEENYMISLLLLLILLFGLLRGLKRGFIVQLMHLVGFILAFIVSTIFYKKFAVTLSHWIPYPELSENTMWAIFDSAMPLE